MAEDAKAAKDGQADAPTGELTEASATLRRTVSIRAIVTDELKNYLRFELDRGLTELDEVKKRINSQYDGLKAQYKKASDAERLDGLERDYKAEIERVNVQGRELMTRRDQVAMLKDDTLFHQGQVDGFVTLKQGDNLYKKLGAMEIVVKDGIVQSINSEGAPWIGD